MTTADFTEDERRKIEEEVADIKAKVGKKPPGADTGFALAELDVPVAHRPELARLLNESGVIAKIVGDQIIVRSS